MWKRIVLLVSASSAVYSTGYVATTLLIGLIAGFLALLVIPPAATSMVWIRNGRLGFLKADSKVLESV